MSIRCSLSLANLEDDSCTYEALSYEWGPPTDTFLYIWLDGCKFAVRPNLWSALYYLKRAGHRGDSRDNGETAGYGDDGENQQARILWIDALCIDQENEEERNHQVRQMGMIYQHATRVVAWLGPTIQDRPIPVPICLGLEFIEHLGTTRQKRYDDVFADWRVGFGDSQIGGPPIRKDDYRWEFMHQVLHMTYWTRLWVIQELVLAKDIVLKFGKHSVSFRALEHVLGQSRRWDLTVKWVGVKTSWETRAFLNNSPAVLTAGNTTAFKVAQQHSKENHSIINQTRS